MLPRFLVGCSRDDFGQNLSLAHRQSLTAGEFRSEDFAIGAVQAMPRPGGDDVADSIHDGAGRERLLDEIEGAVPDRLDHSRNAAPARHGNDGRGIIVSADFFENVRPRTAGHENIENNAGRRRPRSRGGAKRLHVAERRHPIACRAECRIEKLADHRIVVDDENFGADNAVVRRWNTRGRGVRRTRTRFQAGFIKHDLSPIGAHQAS